MKKKLKLYLSKNNLVDYFEDVFDQKNDVVISSINSIIKSNFNDNLPSFDAEWKIINQ